MKKVVSAVAEAALVGLMPPGNARAQRPGLHLSGAFDVFWVNCTGSNAERSLATDENFPEQFGRAERQRREAAGGPEPTCTSGSAIYTGALQFRTTDPSSKTTISQWLKSSGAELEVLSGEPSLRLSKAPDASDPDTRTTTIFTLLPDFPVPPVGFADRPR